jgi:hypothetical protein
VNSRSTTQTLLIALGVLLIVGGVVCVILDFAEFASADPADDSGRAFALFGGGGLAAVIGLGVIAFTRTSIMRANGAYSRVVIEQGYGATTGGRFCPSCGLPVQPTAKFCDSCGTALG